MSIRKIPPSQMGFLSLRGKQQSGSQAVSGIGTSNKTIEAYIEELKQAGIKLVLDVRARPQSQFYPHFNQKRLKAALEENGIHYEWLGETLGNPKDESGARTLDGFKAHMKTPAYAKGIARLMELVQQANGPVALTCSEKNEKECHRSLILQDVRQRLASPD